MSIKNLTIYLNDHLAGSVMALELIERAAKPSAGTPLARFLEQLHGEIEEDQTVVRDLLRRLDASENPVKKATAWIAEKAGRVKIDASNTADDLGRFEALETLKLGILGKLALLVALEQVAGEVRALAGLDVVGSHRSRLGRRAVATPRTANRRAGLSAARRSWVPSCVLSPASRRRRAMNLL